MEILKTLIWVIYIISALVIIVLVLLQQGKGADAGATFGGGGSSNSLFGASGSSNFMSRSTAIAAFIFFAGCLALAHMFSSGSKESKLGLMGSVVIHQKNNSSKLTQVDMPTKKMIRPIKNQIPE